MILDNYDLPGFRVPRPLPSFPLPHLKRTEPPELYCLPRQYRVLDLLDEGINEAMDLSVAQRSPGFQRLDEVGLRCLPRHAYCLPFLALVLLADDTILAGSDKSYWAARSGWLKAKNDIAIPCGHLSDTSQALRPTLCRIPGHPLRAKLYGEGISHTCKYLLDMYLFMNYLLASA